MVAPGEVVETRRHVPLADHAALKRIDDVARFLQRTGARVHGQTRAGDGRIVGPLSRCARAGGAPERRGGGTPAFPEGYTTCPAAHPEAHAHWTLYPPSPPVPSHPPRPTS